MADDLPGEIERIRSEKPLQVQKKLRYVVTDEVANATVFSISPNVAVEPGVSKFASTHWVELAESLHAVAHALDMISTPTIAEQRRNKPPILPQQCHPRRKSRQRKRPRSAAQP